MQRYDLIFDGNIAAGQDLSTVKQRLAELYGVSIQEVERLFAHPPIVIKRDLDESAAMSDKAEFETTGALCRLQRTETQDHDANGLRSPCHRRSPEWSAAFLRSAQ